MAGPISAVQRLNYTETSKRWRAVEDSADLTGLRNELTNYSADSDVFNHCAKRPVNMEKHKTRFLMTIYYLCNEESLYEDLQLLKSNTGLV